MSKIFNIGGMMTTVEPRLDDNEPVRMTFTERTVWVSVVTVAVSADSAGGPRCA